MSLFDVRVIDPADPAAFGKYLEDWSSLGVSTNRKEPGSLSFTCPRNAGGRDDMRAKQVVVFLQDGKEGDNCRFVLRNVSTNMIGDTVPLEDYQLSGLLDAFRDTTWRSLTGTKTRKWENVTPGAMARDIIGNGASRNAYDWWGYRGMTFTDTADSNGNAWADLVDDAELEFGMPVYEALDWLLQGGWLEMSTTRGYVNAYNPGGRAVDRTVGSSPVVLEAGLDLTDAPHQETWDDFVNELTVIGEEKTTYKDDGTSTYTPPRHVYVSSGVDTWGRREKSIKLTGTNYPPTMEKIGRRYLNNMTGPRWSRTYSIQQTDPVVLDAIVSPTDTPAVIRPVPMVNYKVGDLIGVELADGNGVRKERVEIISATCDSRNVGTYLITVNDWLNDRDRKVDRLLARYGGQ